MRQLKPPSSLLYASFWWRMVIIITTINIIIYHKCIYSETLTRILTQSLSQINKSIQSIHFFCTKNSMQSTPLIDINVPFNLPSSAMENIFWTGWHEMVAYENTTYIYSHTTSDGNLRFVFRMTWGGGLWRCCSSSSSLVSFKTVFRLIVSIDPTLPFETFVCGSFILYLEFESTILYKKVLILIAILLKEGGTKEKDLCKWVERLTHKAAIQFGARITSLLHIQPLTRGWNGDFHESYFKQSQLLLKDWLSSDCCSSKDTRHTNCWPIHNARFWPTVSTVWVACAPPKQCVSNQPESNFWSTRVTLRW